MTGNPTMNGNFRATFDAAESDLLHLVSSAFSNTNESIIITDAVPKIVLANRAFCEASGYDLNELIGRNPGSLKSGRHDKAFYESMWSELLSKGEWQGEIWNRRKNGELHPSWLVVNAVCDLHGIVQNYVGVFTDITKIKEAENRLQDLAYHDVLTKLPNRALFYECLNQSFKRAHRNSSKVGVLFVDLDHFKQVNDTFGHESGDLLLCETAHRLSHSVREADTVARLGGDEFVVLIEDLKETKSLCLIAQKIKHSISEPVIANGRKFSVSASIGISIYPDDSQDGEELLRKADEAMYFVKRAGRADFRFYSGNGP